MRLVDRVTGRMRAANRSGRTVVLRLRFRDYKRISRSRTLPYPTAASRTVLASARVLMAEAMPQIEERGVTMVGVALTGIEDGRGVQLEMPVEPPYRPPVDAVLGPGARAVRVRGAAAGERDGFPLAERGRGWSRLTRP